MVVVESTPCGYNSCFVANQQSLSLFELKKWKLSYIREISEGYSRKLDALT